MKRRLFLAHAGAAALSAATPLPLRAQTRPLIGSGLRGMRNALEFGVAPDTDNDQTAAFQAMLETVAAEGNALFLPGGLYVLAGIELPSGLLIEGVPGRTRLVHAGTGPLLHAAGADAITLRGLTVDGVSRPADGDQGLLDLRAVTAFTLEDCGFENAGVSAIHLERSSAALIRNSVSDASGVAIFGRDCDGLRIDGNTIRRCANGGILVYRSEPGRDGAVITGNSISGIGAANGGTGQWGNGINLFRADDTIVANNVISGSAFSAIRGNTVRNMQVTGNVCRDSGETAIYAEFAFENALISDNLVDGAANGISAPNLDHGGHGATISGNIVRNLHASGPYDPGFPGFGTGIGVEADAVVTGNLIEGAPLYGISAGWGPFLRDVLVASNTIRDARFGIGVSAADGAGRALIRGNLIAARETGIQAHAWAEAVAPDLLAEPAAAPANITLSDNLSTAG
ncbi:MAG: TIGR03808 family TAT-translocated repetitive protein [Ahrensia sp.]|nr:TIGR03808 family TAT-translocated repetitive protein [Ahrensia sp.]